MQIRCDRCGKEIDSAGNYCPFCGEEAPRKTVLFDDKPRQIENPVYCPACSAANIEEAMFCSSCGEMVYRRPDKEVFYCYKCRERNRGNSLVCCSCGVSFENWFEMKGETAEKFGYKGDLTLTEKMTERTYHFTSRRPLKIGKKEDNDIVIPCSWVSRYHCLIDLDTKKITDSSKNGTFINRSPDRISQESILYLNEFNIAGSFTFTVYKRRKAYCIHLGAILGEEDCRRYGDGEAYDNLRKQWYILYDGDFKIDIQKLDGAVAKKKRPGVSMYRFESENGYYYYTDNDRGIERYLLRKDINVLPANWKAEFRV